MFGCAIDVGEGVGTGDANLLHGGIIAFRRGFAYSRVGVLGTDEDSRACGRDEKALNDATLTWHEADLARVFAQIEREMGSPVAQLAVPNR